MIRLGDKSGKSRRLAVLALLGLLLAPCACPCNFPSTAPQTAPQELTPSGQVEEPEAVVWIGSEGGEISCPGGARVIIPEGTLSQDAQITVRQVSSIPDLPADLPVEPAGPAYDLAFSEEVELLDLMEVYLPLYGQPDSDPTNYAVFMWDGSGWHDMGGFVEGDIIRTYIDHHSILVAVNIRGVGRRPVRFSPCAYAGIQNLRIFVATYAPSPDMPWVPVDAVTPCFEHQHGYMMLPLGCYTWCVDYIDDYDNSPECYWDRGTPGRGIGCYGVHDGLPKDIRNAYPIDFQGLPPMPNLEAYCGSAPPCPVSQFPAPALTAVAQYWLSLTPTAPDSGGPGPDSTPSGISSDVESWFTDANADRYCNELMPEGAKLARAYVDEPEIFGGEPRLRCESALDDRPVLDINIVAYPSDADAAGMWREIIDTFDELLADGIYDHSSVLVAERTETEIHTVEDNPDYGFNISLHTIYGNCVVWVLEDSAPDPGEAVAPAIVNNAKRLIDQLRGN